MVKSSYRAPLYICMAIEGPWAPSPSLESDIRLDQERSGEKSTASPNSGKKPSVAIGGELMPCFFYFFFVIFA